MYSTLQCGTVECVKISAVIWEINVGCRSASNRIYWMAEPPHARFRTGQAERPRQANSLAATAPEQFGDAGLRQNGSSY
jgi:hypothetical protein